MLFLKQATASQSLLIGPFIDDTDGKTAETGLTIANTDIRLSVNGGNIAAKNSGGGTHDELGYYTITLDATDTATVGRLQLAVHVSGALPVYHEFWVLEEAVFDGLFAASAAGPLLANSNGSGLTEAGGTGDHLTAVPWNAAWDAEVESEVDDALGSGTGTALTAVPWNAAWDAEVQSEVQDAIEANNLDHLVKIAVDTDFATTVHADSVVGQLADNGAGYDRTTDSLEVIRNTIGSPANVTVSADIADVEGKVDDLESRLGTPSNLGSGATVAANLVDIEGQTDDIGVAGAGLTEAGGTGDHLTAVPWNAAWDAEVQSEVDDALGATVADSVPSDGTRPSVKQALLMITRFLMERSVSSTTVTVNKEDGTTASMTFTLDDATNPTSITRAT